MKKISIFIFVFAISIIYAPALAHAPGVTIERTHGQSVVPGEIVHLVLPHVPFEVDVEGTVTHGSPGNLSPVFLSGLEDGVLFYGPEKYFKNEGNSVEGAYSIPWTIPREGIFNITVVVRHGNSESSALLGSHDGIGGERNGCQAAPAIASRYLRNLDIKMRNIISKVAFETGKKGSLWAFESCEETYEEETITFIVDMLD